MRHRGSSNAVESHRQIAKEKDQQRDHKSQSTRHRVLPRMLRRADAAAYCGLSEPRFVEACPIPPVAIMGRIPRYDRHALDQWLDGLGDDGDGNVADIDLAAEWTRGQNNDAR
jgi:hypothetical protein